MKPVITEIDIETAPTLGWVWGAYEQNVIAVDRNWFILSFAYRDLDGKQTVVKALPDYKTYQKNPHDDRELVKDLWQVYDRSDVVIGHHIDRFDTRKSNARFVYHGFLPPSPFKSIDTLKIARKHFKFDSSRLNDLAEYLGVGSKLPHRGFKHTWLGCMAGDPKAWREMRRYNKHDIDPLLHGVYLKLRPWASAHVNLDNYTKNDSCPYCQLNRLIHRGWAVTKTGRRQRLHCQSCGGWSQGITHEKQR